MSYLVTSYSLNAFHSNCVLSKCFMSYLVGEDGVDFAYFCGLHANVTDKFTQMCHEWEEKSNKLEEDLKNDDGSFEGVKIEDGKTNY